MDPNRRTLADEMAAVVREPMLGAAGAMAQAIESGVVLNFIEDFDSDTRDSILYATCMGLYAGLLHAASKIERLEATVAVLYDDYEARLGRESEGDH
jgi:hypothetical protein